MKKVLLALLIVLFMFGLAEAKRDKCYWIWSVAVTDVNDAPDSVYCSLDGRAFASQGATYIQNAQGAKEVTVFYDTTWDNSATVPEIGTTVTPCSNTATPDINILACTSSNCSTGTTTVVYHQVDSIADNIRNGFAMTPLDSFKITVDENASTNGCITVITTVIW